MYFIVPIPVIQITIYGKKLGNNTLGSMIGDPLTLDCTVTAVRGISSPVDIIWTTGGRVVRRVDNITADIVNDSAIYTDSFKISSLTAIDNGREYHCTVVINASQLVNNSDRFTLIFPGEYTYLRILYAHICMYCCITLCIYISNTVLNDKMTESYVHALSA